MDLPSPTARTPSPCRPDASPGPGPVPPLRSGPRRAPIVDMNDTDDAGVAVRTRPTKIGTARTGKSYLVIGGHGFLGSHVVEALLARGEDRVRVLDLRSSPLFAPEVA